MAREKKLSDVDSAGVYFVSVEDFEWRPPQPACTEPKTGEKESPASGDGEKH